MKKGFTLIELLAVIVILAIIALIATPIVLNIISDARIEGRKRSAESLTYSMKTGYLSATMLTEASGTGGEISVKNIIDKTEIDNEETRDNESITTKDGVKCTITSSDNIFIITCVDINNNDAVLTTKEILVGLSSQSNSKIAKLESGTARTVGAKYSVKVNDSATYYFYILSFNNNDTVNLIMDRNICSDGSTEYTSTNSYCRYAWHAGGNNNNYGPDTAMTTLYNTTKNWTNVLDMIMNYTDENNSGKKKYGYESIVTDKDTKVTTITGKNGATNTTIGNFAYPLKARIATQTEVENVGCNYSSMSSYGSCPTWLVENMSYVNVSNYLGSNYTDKYAMNKNNSKDIQDYCHGYWLLSSNPGYTENAYYVTKEGMFGAGNTYNLSSRIGIRPVITISINDL